MYYLNRKNEIIKMAFCGSKTEIVHHFLNFSLLLKLINELLKLFYYVHSHIVHLRQDCHNSKFGIFELLV